MIARDATRVRRMRERQPGADPPHLTPKELIFAPARGAMSVEGHNHLLVTAPLSALHPRRAGHVNDQ